MIRFVKHTEIDAAKWDETILNAQFPTIFCTYQLLNILSNYSWNALLMDDYDYVMPLPTRSKGGVAYIYSPFFISQLGVFSKKEISKEIVAAFFKAIPKKFKHIDLLLNSANDASLVEPHISTLISHELDLRPSYEILHSGFSQNTKRNIKSSQKHSLTLVRDHISVEEIIKLFCENRGQAKEVHYHSTDYETLAKAAAVLKNLNRLETYGVKTEDGHNIAGGLFVRDEQRYWFWFSGRNEQYADTKSMFFLMDEFIKHHAEQPYLLDFNGSMNENVSRLYKGFGGQPYDIRMINFTNGFFWKCFLKLYKIIRG